MLLGPRRGGSLRLLRLRAYYDGSDVPSVDAPLCDFFAVVSYHVDWEKHDKLPPGTAYFHAHYRQALPAPADGSTYTILDVEGRGFFAVRMRRPPC